jgi:hypothetical protein
LGCMCSEVSLRKELEGQWELQAVGQGTSGQFPHRSSSETAFPDFCCPFCLPQDHSNTRLAAGSPRSPHLQISFCHIRLLLCFGEPGCGAPALHSQPSLHRPGHVCVCVALTVPSPVSTCVQAWPLLVAQWGMRRIQVMESQPQGATCSCFPDGPSTWSGVPVLP